MSKKEETKFKEKVQKDLNSLVKCWHEKIQQKSIRGTPDILACINGVFVAIELKVDSKLSNLQEYKLKKIRASNGIAIEVTPENWEGHFEVLKIIAEKM